MEYECYCGNSFESQYEADYCDHTFDAVSDAEQERRIQNFYSEYPEA